MRGAVLLVVGGLTLYMVTRRQRSHSSKCRHIMVIGDSIAASVGSSGTLTKALQNVSGHTVTSFGIPGLTMKRVERLKPALTSPEFAQADTIIVSLGANDAIELRDAHYVEASLRSRVQAAVAYIAAHMHKGQRLVWSTYPKDMGALPFFQLLKPNARTTMATAHAALTHELARLHVLTFDYAQWQQHLPSIQTMLAADGLHPNARGYAHLAKAWHALAVC